MECIVIIEHVSKYHDPLTFRRADELVLGRMDDEYPGWIWVSNYKGKAGWAPMEFLEISDELGIAKVQYSAKELGVKPRELLNICNILNGWVLAINSIGEKGWIPLSNVKIL